MTLDSSRSVDPVPTGDGQALERFAHQLPGVIYQFQLFPDGRSCFPFASDAMREIYEVAPQDVREDARLVFSRLHPDDVDAVRASILASASTLQDWRFDYRVILPVQGERWRRGQARPERCADGSTVWYGFITDITDLKRIETSLLQREAAIAASLTAIVMADPAGTLTYVNRAFLEIWGHRDAADVIGTPFPAVWRSSDEAARALDAVRTAGTWSGELSARRNDGTERVLQVHATVYLDTLGNPAGMLTSMLDVTDARRLQAQFLQAQKMESIGRLAGGVAHDFNNLLTVIQGYLGLARLAIAESHPAHHDLAEIERAAASAASLTQQLLAFSRKQLIHPVVLDLNDVVRRVQAMLRRLLGDDISLVVGLRATRATVRFDAAQADQILINLAVNARDAMPDGGMLTIETEDVEITSEQPEGPPVGSWVRLSVSDTGTGMSDEVKAHLFEPFFTTKAPGAGTGLGLAMIYGSVSQHGGVTDVLSELGRGTVVRILLPRVLDDRTASPEDAEVPRGTEHVVLVEDDEQVRALAQRMLRQLGYRVESFRDGTLALEAVREEGIECDLLMTDVILPGMNGRELATAMRKAKPRVAVLFTSGYTANVMPRDTRLDRDGAFLPKPYTLDQLARRLRDALDR